MKRLISIDTKYASFALIAEDGVIVEAADIAKWTVGKSMQRACQWYKGHRAAFILMKALEGDDQEWYWFTGVPDRKWVIWDGRKPKWLENMIGELS